MAQNEINAKNLDELLKSSKIRDFIEKRMCENLAQSRFVMGFDKGFDESKSYEVYIPARPHGSVDLLSPGGELLMRDGKIVD